MIKQIGTKNVYQNKWMTVREDQVEFAGGQKGIYGVVEKIDFALTVPFDGQHFYLVKQFRYPIQKFSWEFPQGMYEDTPEMDPMELAKRELKEETGLLAQKITEIGYFAEAPGYSNQYFHLFLATEFTQGEQQLEVSEQGMEVGKFSVTQFEEMVANGELLDAPTVSAYGLLKAKKII
jgi:8-oxo-dGTP pyrophosphatase MutT (NUDIX family)